MSPSTLTLGGMTPAEQGNPLPTRKLKSSPFNAILSILKRFAAAVQASQEARAKQVVLPYLARMPDDDLAALGYTSAQISTLRTYRHLPVVRWV